jgi:hypothetical protein
MPVTLTANTPVSGVLQQRTTVNVYTLTVAGVADNATRTYRFQTRNRAGGGQENALQTTLYNAAGDVLGASDRPDLNGIHQITAALVNGTYTLHVGATSRAAFPRYTVKAAQP